MAQQAEAFLPARTNAPYRREHSEDCDVSMADVAASGSGAPSDAEYSIWSMQLQKKKKLRDFIVGTALILMFAAGVMRTSIPSLIYAAFSVQALYAGGRAGFRSAAPGAGSIARFVPPRFASVACIGVLAAGVILFHAVVNGTSLHYSPLLLQLLGSCIVSSSSTGRVYVSFLSDALALIAALVLCLGHLLHSASENDTNTAAAAPRQRPVVVSEATADGTLKKGRFALLLFWGSGSITPMGPCIGINLILARTILRKDTSVSEPVLNIVRFLLATALSIFWIGQFFAQLGAAWNSSSAMSQLLYTDDITGWQWDRTISFAATALAFVFLAPLFKPLNSSAGVHALIDSWLSFNVSSKPILTILHIMGCVSSCIWAGLGPTLLVIPVLCLACYALIECVHRQKRIPIAFALSCYIVLLQLARTLTLSLLLAIADSFEINFSLIFELGLTTTQISTLVAKSFAYDASRHVFLRFLGWFSCLILSFQWGLHGNPSKPSDADRVELRPTQEREHLLTVAADSFAGFASKFSADSVRFLACVFMYFVGLDGLDLIHAVIFVVAVLYRPIVFVINLATSEEMAHLWLWRIMAAYTTIIACLFVIFNLPFIDAPSDALWGLGLQKNSISNSWRNFLPVAGVMAVCNLLMANSIHVLHIQQTQASSKLRAAPSLSEPLLQTNSTDKNLLNTNFQVRNSADQSHEAESLLSIIFKFINQLYDFFMRDYFRLLVCLVLMLRSIGVLSRVQGSPSLLRHTYTLFCWMLVSVIAYHQQWNGRAARSTKIIWPWLIVYAGITIAVRYVYLFVHASDPFDFTDRSDFEKAIGLISSVSSIQSDSYTYFAADAVLLVLFFIQFRRFSELEASGWQWPRSPLIFCFPKIEKVFQNALSVHGEKGFLVSLIAASVVNGVTVIGCMWASFFTVVVLFRTALESSWAIALFVSMVYCTLAVIAPMPLANFPGQTSSFADSCDTDCLMGFIGLESVTPYNVSSCTSRPFYCKNILLSDQLIVSLCIAVSAAFMRLGHKCDAPTQRSEHYAPVVPHAAFRYRRELTLVPPELNKCQVQVEVHSIAGAAADAPHDSEVWSRTHLKLLFCLHNCFYAFAFEIFVITTCVLINFKPVDLWTSVYIVHLLVCLLCEDNQNELMRLASFYFIAIALVSRYALVLCLGRGSLYLDPSWAVWLGLKTDPTLYPDMGFSEYFLYDFAIVLISFFYQRQICTSIRFSCTGFKSKARSSLLKDYAEFAVALLRSSMVADAVDSALTSKRAESSRFSLDGIYRQFSLNYDRISACAGLLVLVIASIHSVPSLPSLVVICLFTFIIVQFDVADGTQTKRRRVWICVNVVVVLSLFMFVVMQSSILDISNGSWGLITFLGFGKCRLPTRQVALLGISLIAASVYLRWREQRESTVSKEIQEASQKKKHDYLRNWIRAEQTFVIEKFKRSQLLVKTVKRQHAAASVEDESQSDVVSSVESDSGIACLQPHEPEAIDEGFFGSCCVFIKSILVAMIDKGTYVSQQTYKSGGSDSDYPSWLEQEWSMCITKSFRSLAYFVIASNSTAIYVAAFVVNHAVQEDVISGIPLVFIFGLFLLMRPFPGENVMRVLAFYSALSLIFRKMFRLATAASVIYQQNYNLTQSLAFCDQQLDISNSTTYVTLSNSKYMFITAGSFSEVFVIMAIQLHMSVRRSRGITNHIDYLQLDPFVSLKREELISRHGLSSKKLDSMKLLFGRHAPLHHCASYRATLRHLWDKASIGATKFSSTNGVDYYSSLFAFELMAFSMYLRYHYHASSVNLTILQIAERNQTAKWIGYSFLQFVLMLFGRAIYVKRSSSLHLVLHFVQVVSWFPISLMCLSDNCSSVDALGSVGSAWNVGFLLIKCSYLFISARQFCTGFDMYRFDYGLFPNDYGTLSYYSWSLYRLIPFVYELQLLVDWTFSSTTLLFEEWINVEQILAYVFRQRCLHQYKRLYNVSCGRVLNFWKIKIWSGVGLVLVVILILWGPLALSVLVQILSPPFSNPITTAVVQVSMNITFQSSSATYSLFSLTARELQSIGCSTSETALYPSISKTCDRASSAVRAKIQVQRILFNVYSESIWMATPEIRDLISKELKATDVQVSFSSKFTMDRQSRQKSFPLEFVQTVTYTQLTNMMSVDQLRNLSILFDNTNVTSTVSVSNLIPNILDASLTSLNIFPDDNSSDIVTLALNSNATEVKTNVQWWSFRNFLSSSNASTFKIYVLSQPVPYDFFAVFNYSLVAIYVLIIGFSAARLRSFLVSNVSDLWLQESACPDHLWSIASHIWIARNADEPLLESRLYRQLVDLLRSPESLVAIGKQNKEKLN